MADRRLPGPRVVGIVAWTAASIAWSTALVAMANAQTEAPVEDAADSFDPPPAVEYLPIEAPMPVLPSGGLVILRYTPTEKPEPQTVVRRVVQAAPASSSSKSTKTKSSGS